MRLGSDFQLWCGSDYDFSLWCGSGSFPYQSDVNLQPVDYRPSTNYLMVRLHWERLRSSMAPFWLPQFLNFDRNSGPDPDPAFDSDADPDLDPAFHFDPDPQYSWKCCIRSDKGLKICTQLTVLHTRGLTWLIRTVCDSTRHNITWNIYSNKEHCMLFFSA